MQLPIRGDLFKFGKTGTPRSLVNLIKVSAPARKIIARGLIPGLQLFFFMV